MKTIKLSLVISFFFSLSIMTAFARQNQSNTITMRLDYSGAETIMKVLERDSLSDTDLDDVLQIQGVRAMVDNVTRFIPHIGIPEFRREILTFAKTKKPGEFDPYFRLSGVWQERLKVRALIAAIKADERRIVNETLSQVKRYLPNTGPLPVTVYFTVGGVSTGFVFENDLRSFYANLVRANGDLNGVGLNMAHETYHILQIAALERAGINARWISDDKMPPIERLLAGTLIEGTANYVADPTRSRAAGPDMESARERYRRNAEPARIREIFALFDMVIKELREGRIKWEEANLKGFTSQNDDAFYFVGYEMAKAIDRYCGSKCISKLFDKPPVEFFRQYIALYRKHPQISGRFSKDTEIFIEAFK